MRDYSQFSRKEIFPVKALLHQQSTNHHNLSDPTETYKMDLEDVSLPSNNQLNDQTMDTTKTMITTRIYTIILDMYHHHQQQQKQQQPGQAIQKQFWQQQKKSISQAHIKFLV